MDKSPYFIFIFIMMMITISPIPASETISSLMELLMMVLMVTMMSMSLTTAQKRTLIYHMRWAGYQKVDENHLKEIVYSLSYLFIEEKLNYRTFLIILLFLNLSIYLYVLFTKVMITSIITKTAASVDQFNLDISIAFL